MLIPKDLISKLPKLYSTETDKDPTVHLKFYNPIGRGTWFLTEYDPLEKLAFGYVDLGSPELGYFSIGELESIELRYGMKIERDEQFIPAPLSIVKASYLSRC